MCTCAKWLTRVCLSLLGHSGSLIVCLPVCWHSNRTKWGKINALSCRSLSWSRQHRLSCVCEWQVCDSPREVWKIRFEWAFFIHINKLPSLPTSYIQSWGLSTPESCTFWAFVPAQSAPALWWSSFSPYQTKARTTSEAWACLGGWRGAWTASGMKKMRESNTMRDERIENNTLHHFFLLTTWDIWRKLLVLDKWEVFRELTRCKLN